MGKNYRYPVSYPVHKFSRQQINDKLDSKIECYQHSDLAERYVVTLLKCQEKQRHKVVDDRLHYIAHKTDVHCFLVFILHCITSQIISHHNIK